MDANAKGCACAIQGSSPKPPPRQSFGQPTAPIDVPRGSKQSASGGPAVGSLETESLDEKTKERLAREQKEQELSRWVSPLRQFDLFASAELKRRDELEEDYPRLKVPQLKGHHRCRVSCLLNHNVDYAIEMEQDLRNIGIQETHMLDMLEKLTRAEAAVRFQGAVRAAEVAAMSAPPELAEEAAVAGARGYTVETHEFSKSSKPGENPIEIIGYIGCTRPTNF